MLESIRLELAHLDMSRRALRNFGLVMGAVAGLVATFILWKSGWQPGPWSTGLSVGGAVFAIVGLVAPRALVAVYRAWMGLALALGFVMTRVILTLVFSLVVFPIGLIMRLIGKNPLALRPDSTCDTYWIRRVEPENRREQLTRYW
jgi:hypothetical protein